MSLPPALAEHKTLLAAILMISTLAARLLGVKLTLDVSVKELAERHDINRTYIYEVRDRLIETVSGLAAIRPGRPLKSHEKPADDTAQQVTIAVLRFQAEHPGAVLPRRYAPAFRRFVLRLYDAWPADRTLADFATAAEIPFDTLRDWLDKDRRGLTPPVPPPPEPLVPVDASDLTREIAEAVRTWMGSMREFIRRHASTFGLLENQLRRVLILLGMISPRKPQSWPKSPRFRGETDRLSPGVMLVCDGKRIELQLTGSQQYIYLNWQGIVDQATGTNTAFVVTEEETAQAVIDAYRDSLRFLGARRPLALLIDNRLCRDEDDRIASAIEPTEIIRCTEGRPTHKALLEGAFGKWEQFVGPIVVDDSSPEALWRSIVHEVARAYCAGRDHAPDPEFQGASRIATLREYVPSPGQLRRDSRFLRNLKERHEARRQPAREQPLSRLLLDQAFERYDCLRGKDRSGNLRRYLAYCDPCAVRRALALFDFRIRQNAIDTRFAHRYLKTLVVSHQEEFELDCCESTLLELARQQGQLWTEALERDLEKMKREAASTLELLCRIAEQAAFGGLPVEGVFWTERLFALLTDHQELSQNVRTHIKRLYEAPVERRLYLLDQIHAHQVGIT